MLLPRVVLHKDDCKHGNANVDTLGETEEEEDDTGTGQDSESDEDEEQTEEPVVRNQGRRYPL